MLICLTLKSVKSEGCEERWWCVIIEVTFSPPTAEKFSFIRIHDAFAFGIECFD
jgi:hypothetical protein